MDEINPITLKALKKDSRYRTSSILVQAAKAIVGPAFEQERAFGAVIGATLSRMAKAEALRKLSGALPQNSLKVSPDLRQETLAVDAGKGVVINGKT